jgi:hypothetical protein
MISRKTGWEGPSDFIKEFNKKHNPDFYYGKNTEEEKTSKKKIGSKRYATKQYPVFKVQD